MTLWIDLLNKIFPGSEPSEPWEDFAYKPPEVPDDPTKRLHAMRKIKGNTWGFARLYDAVDLVQFCRQIDYMRDFDDRWHLEQVPFSKPMPVYDDMSVAQLRCYFSWRTKTRAGLWEPIPFSYVLLRVFELLNTHDAPVQVFAQLAQLWLQTRARHTKLDLCMPQWLKDYYICHAFDCPFEALAEQNGLEVFFVRKARTEDPLALSSYRWQNSRFFRDNPSMTPVLAAAVHAAIKNLRPLLALYGCPSEGTFFPQPMRFLFYEPYRDAAAAPPVQIAAREVRFSASEIYRLRGGSWSRAMENGFRLPSHGLGWLAKCTETELRACAGYTAPWRDPEAKEQLERWLHSDCNVAVEALTADPRCAQIVRDCARAAYAGNLPADLLPCAAALAEEMRREPLRSILALREVTGRTEAAIFKKQGRLLAALSDNYAPAVGLYGKTAPSYCTLNQAQLRTYLTWRTKYRQGVIEKTDTAYVLLFCRELECGIGTKDPLGSLCEVLRDYAPFDKFVARQLPNKIVACVQKSGLPLEPALLRHRVELWFPHLFLLRQGSPQLPVFQHLASYNLQKSRFYHPKNAALFEDCFAALLAAATEAFAAAKLPFGDVMRGAAANAVATFLLKRMEQRLREHADYPYPLSAIPSKMFKNTAQNQRRLHTFLCADTLANAVDDAVDAFARTHDITPLRAAPRPPKPKKSGTNHKNEAPGLAQEPASPPKPVKINFARLERIRAEAAEMTERLLTEAAEEDVPPAKTPPPLTKNFVGESFYRTLAPAQIAFLEAGRFEDELLVEEINAIALDCFGDTLIEGGKLIEDYENWREL